MNINRLKSLSWLAVLLVGSYLGFFIYGFLEDRRGEIHEISEEEQDRALSKEAVGTIDSPKSSLVDYTKVELAFHQMNWTGKKPPKVVVARADAEENQAPPLKPVSDLLHVLLVQVDFDSPEGSLAVVKYLDQQLLAAAAADSELRYLRLGQRLSSPYQNIRVEEIDVVGVRFSFDDETREHEHIETTRNPRESESQIVKVGEGGAILPVRESMIGKNANAAVWNPKETSRIGRNTFRIGTEDVTRMETDYSRILSQDIRYKQKRDPRSGKIVGLEVTHVSAGSMPQRAGLSQGEVVKSINGHKVTSLNGAIAFVKKETDTTDTWLVVLEKQGREYTRTYHSPEE